MKQYKFKLESVLSIRERAETEAQQSHAAAGRRLESILSELSEAEEELKRLNEQLEGMQRSTFRPAEREILWNALKYQKDLCARLEMKAEIARKDLEEKREVLLDARRDHEAMVKMEEKDHEEYKRLAELEERSMIDDIVSARHTTNRQQTDREAKL
jgi:flagellar FliJ protein